MAAPISLADPDTIGTRYWHRLDDGRIQCDVCPRACKLRNGQRGVCFVRACADGRIALTSYGRSTGLCVDPIEKKPLYHFLPGSAVLSFGTAGCNLACSFCQNWDITKATDTERRSQWAAPDDIAETAVRLGVESVAFTYNDPVVFLEYAIDTAMECRERGIRTVAVTAGYVMPEPRAALFAQLDAANIDLKAFSDDFYRKVIRGRLAPVLETIEYAVHETRTWVELTTLIIPGYNDSDTELAALCSWVADRLGSEVPIHFTAFHPDYKMRNVPRTPPGTLTRARALARQHGLEFVYTGNVIDPEGQRTRCPSCHDAPVDRSWHSVTEYHITPGGRCPSCATTIQGRFAKGPGDWGPQRVAVAIEGNAI